MKTQQNDRLAAIRFLDAVFASADPEKRVGVKLWDGTVWPDGATRNVTVKLQHPGALRMMFGRGTELGLAESFLRDDFDIEGDAEAVFPLLEKLVAHFSGWRQRLQVFKLLRTLPRAGADRIREERGSARLKGRLHSESRDKEAVTYHYDLSNEFYQLWLDRNMVYSCAYFMDENDDLDRAQEQKLDLICRKLRLKKGQRFLDLGCGWGGLLQYAAANYGVDATGVTLSRLQAELAGRRLEAAGLADKARVLTSDYRNLSHEKKFDAIASVGMFEHVGTGQLARYFAHVRRMLKPGGVFLNHGIARHNEAGEIVGTRFVQAYVFPDGQLSPICNSLRSAEEAGLEVRDVDGLREHYARTLRMWVERLEGQRARAVEMLGEATYRVWRIYMAGSAYGFSTGRLKLYQTLFSKPAEGGAARLPLTRDDWYSRSKDNS